ncbi:toxin-activating lysine-acyltransferase [Polycladidibacter hongkongensis]|uniref:toxin-activating lysine-acyltransferase n=1 Tax=Polycladidibacter hongkongensis TaxID=1647556 RepID=UPI00082C828D|nr:toxin-activating lysine-acyltransferase [Pseudovibrio hongkongensis]
MQSEQFTALGKISWLWQSSPLHKEWELAAFSRFVLPAIASKQYCILEHDGAPVAYCSWALLDIEAEAKYLADPSSFSKDSWTCGDRLWFVDWVSPFSARYTWALRSHMKQRFANKLGRSIRVKKGEEKARITAFAGANLTAEQSADIRRQYFKDTVEALKQQKLNNSGIEFHSA